VTERKLINHAAAFPEGHRVRYEYETYVGDGADRVGLLVEILATRGVLTELVLATEVVVEESVAPLHGKERGT
jgi:hypothetical protein